MMPEHPWLVVCAVRLIVRLWAETGGQHLSADQGRVLGQRPGQFLAVGPPEHSDPVRELEPVLFPGLLDQAHHITGATLLIDGGFTAR